MLTIKLRLDEGGGLDPIEVLGDLTISDGHSAIVVKTTFVDTWLESLIVAHHKLKLSGDVKVDVQEPSPLRVRMNPDGSVRISYEDQEVVADSLTALETALRTAARPLLDAIGDLPRSHLNTALKTLREFLDGGGNGQRL
jgi:hypothetical protein